MALMAIELELSFSKSSIGGNIDCMETDNNQDNIELSAYNTHPSHSLTRSC